MKIARRFNAAIFDSYFNFKGAFYKGLFFVPTPLSQSFNLKLISFISPALTQS